MTTGIAQLDGCTGDDADHGYEDTPNASYLKFSETEFVLPPYGTKEVQVYLDFSRQPEYCGRRFMFVIHAFVAGEKVSAGVYSRVYASIE
jgi:hypothetical protein